MIRTHVMICGGTGCTSSDSPKIAEAMEQEIVKLGLQDEVKVVRTGCFGLCEMGPVMIVYPDGTFYSRVKVSDVPEIASEHLLKGRIVERRTSSSTSPSSVWRCATAASSTRRTSRSTSPWTAIPPWARSSPR